MPLARRTSRRTLLAAGVLAVPTLAACTSVLNAGGGAPPRDPVRRESVSDELALVALYDAAIAARPDLTSTLRLIQSQHAEHADTLTRGLAQAAAGVSTPSPSPLAGNVLETLREAERKAVAARSGATVRTDMGELAGLLALISASEAQHVAMLAAIA